MLFLDELDSIAKHRGGGGGGGEGVGDRMLNQLLTEIDGVGAKKNVFVIGATNRPDTIDPALIRGGRLDQMIYIGQPDFEGRIGVLKASTRKSKIAKEVDMTQIAGATAGYSGADLSEICQKAVRIALKNSVEEVNKQIRMLQIQRQQMEKRGQVIDEDYFEQKFMEIQNKANSGVLTKEDFEMAVRQSRQSTSENDLKKYEAFRQQFCDASHGGFATNPKVKDFKFVENYVKPVEKPVLPEPQVEGTVAKSKRGNLDEKQDDFF